MCIRDKYHSDMVGSNVDVGNGVNPFKLNRVTTSYPLGLPISILRVVGYNLSCLPLLLLLDFGFHLLSILNRTFCK